MYEQAGSYVKEQILSSFVRLIATTPDLQTYSVQKLYAGLKEDITQEGLTLAAAWVIGEYGDALLRGGQYEEEELVQEIKESDIVDLCSTILSSSYATQNVSEYTVTALIKLTTRFSDAGQIDRIRRLLQQHTTNLDVEIQQRAVEYSNLFGYDQIRRGVFERMPPPEIREEQRVLGEATAKKKNATVGKKKSVAGGAVSEQDMLLDLMGGDDPPLTVIPGSAGLFGIGGNGGGGPSQADLLADIMGDNGSKSSGSAISTSHRPSASSRNMNNHNGHIMDLFNNSSTTATTNNTPSSINASQQQVNRESQRHEVFNHDHLHLTFQIQRKTEETVQLTASFRNTSLDPSHRISALNLQAAVPKSQTLRLQAISRTDLDGGGGGGGFGGGGGAEAVQVMRVLGTARVSSVVMVFNQHSDRLTD